MGIQPPQFGGMNTQSDAGAIPPIQFTNLINVRVEGPVLQSRGGQSKLNTVAITGTLGCEGFYDASDIGAPDPDPVP